MNSEELLRDHKNIELLRLLQKKPRASITELARHIGMSSPAVKERIVRIEESGILQSYRVVSGNSNCVQSKGLQGGTAG